MHQGNVGDPEDCQRVVQEVIDQHGRLDILVNNAGVTVDRPIWKMRVDDWHKVLRVNLSGAFYMSKPAIVHMLDRGSGRIINISSRHRRNRQHRPSQLHRLQSRALRTHQNPRPRSRLRPQALRQARQGIGVTVNTVTPGLIDTDMVATIPPFMLNKFVEDIPMHRMGQPDEIGRVVSFLAQDASAYITGQIWGVNGGLDM